MQIIHDALGSADLPYGVVATIGNYDGIHRGQQSVLKRVIERARALGQQAVAITFEPHPVSVLRPDKAPVRLTTAEQRQEVLAELGLDALLVVRFNQEVARTEPEDFVRDFLHERLNLQEIYIGSAFNFGKDRRGNVELLQRLGKEYGFEAEGLDETLHLGEPISATRIRRAVAEGKTLLARELLGRPYALRGTIGRGDRMGQRLGWPTINLIPENELLPQNGVYTGRAHFPNMPATFECSINVGTRPTVYETYQRVVESHILDFSADVYGEAVEIRFHKRLREEKMFPSVMELAAQIGRDVEATREYFAARRHDP